MEVKQQQQQQQPWQITKVILNRKDNAKNIKIPNLKLYYKGIVTKWHGTGAKE